MSKLTNQMKLFVLTFHLLLVQVVFIFCSTPSTNTYDSTNYIATPDLLGIQQSEIIIAPVNLDTSQFSNIKQCSLMIFNVSNYQKTVNKIIKSSKKNLVYSSI